MSRYAPGLLVAVCLSFLAGCVRPTEDRHPKEEGLRSVHSAVEAQIRFVNQSGQTVRVYWLDYEGERKLYQTLRAGEDYDQPTYLTHPWLVAGEDGEVWEIYLPTEQPRTIHITAPEKK
jgi:hypothetical protein